MLCNQAIWLDHGRLIEAGPIKKLIQAYEAWSDTRAEAATNQ
jgi:ABC-type polysaccharide/polyol phosphate transport system ATPase subunit